MLIRNLPSFRIHMIILTYDQIGERYKFITRIKKVCDQGVERFRRVLCAVVAKNDGAVSEMFVIADRLNDGVHAVIFPIETIHVRYRCKVRSLKEHRVVEKENLRQRNDCGGFIIP